MSGISLAHSHPTPCSGEKTLRRCRYYDEVDNVILIDADVENLDNVIVIDIPESSPPPRKNDGSSMLRKDNCPFSNVINIDDDDDEDEVPNNSHFVGVDNSRFFSGTSSGESRRVAQKDSADAAVEDCQFGLDKATPFRLSKCKRTYSENFFGRNHYGLDTDSEFDSSDSDDCPDCEVVEDTSGKVQEEWEKAFSRRRKDTNNVHLGTRGHDGTSDYTNKDYHQNAKSKNGTRQCKEASTFYADKSVDEIDAQAFYRTKVDTEFGCTGLSDDTIYDQRNDKFACGQSNFASGKESAKKFDHPIPIVEDEEPSEVRPSPSKPDLFVEEDSCIAKFCPTESEDSVCKSKSSFEREIYQGRHFPEDVHRNVQETATRIVEEMDHLGYKEPHPTGVSKKKKNIMPERCSFKRSKLPDKQTDLSSTTSCDAVNVSGKSLFPKNVIRSVQGKEGNHKETRLQEDNSKYNIQQQENKDDLPSQNGDTQETCIISEREKLKETDEYKRADAEEWASRQQALQMQSEEARRLRQLCKRKKAESMRLLDMERRQKERIEEVRNIQKKDEENMNLKETIRGEVISELKKLEILCKNMASLLHSLGIQVGSWPNPSPQEVQTAYKRAMLTFHPDRAPKSDIRKQVEAEEKFKLVIRTKEKLHF